MYVKKNNFILLYNNSSSVSNVVSSLSSIAGSSVCDTDSQNSNSNSFNKLILSESNIKYGFIYSTTLLYISLQVHASFETINNFLIRSLYDPAYQLETFNHLYPYSVISDRCLCSSSNDSTFSNNSCTRKICETTLSICLLYKYTNVKSFFTPNRANIVGGVDTIGRGSYVMLDVDVVYYDTFYPTLFNEDIL